MTPSTNGKSPDATFAELFALISAARISITETCSILDVSREAWRGWRVMTWRMGPETRARAAVMIHGVRFYIAQRVLPAHDSAVHAEAVSKIRASVDRKRLPSGAPAGNDVVTLGNACQPSSETTRGE